LLHRLFGLFVAGYEMSKSHLNQFRLPCLALPLCGALTLVKKEERLGVIKGLWGDILAEVISPVDGFIRIWFPQHVFREGDTILRGWRI
jgi:hypothetical protein